MNIYSHPEITFIGPDEDPRFAKIQSIHLTKKVQNGVTAIWPTGGKIYKNQIVLISKDGKHTTILRGNCFQELRSLLGGGYMVVNGIIPTKYLE